MRRTKKAAERRRELLGAALLWACAALCVFAVLAARTQPTLAFLAMVAVVTLIVVRSAVES